MLRPLAAALLAAALVAGAALPQDGIRRGTLKALDPGKKTATITADGKDEVFALTADTRVMGADGGRIADPFRAKELAAGTAVMFKAGPGKSDPPQLAGLRVAPAGQPNRPAGAKFDTSKMKPLPALGAEKYQGHEGGLYPGGKNDRPVAHEAAGLAVAKQIRPLGPDGKPAANGKVVLLSVGMSNTTQAFSTFVRLASADPDRNPVVALIDGAQGGMTAARIRDAESESGRRYWGVVDERLKAGGVTREQVQAAWVKQADAGPREGFPKYAETLRDELRDIVRLMHARFPNLKAVYLSGRTYAGYATTGLNPEPYAFESGLSVKWLVEEQIAGKGLNFDPAKGDVKAPWLSWGPYLWANGTAKNADGLFYEASDFGPDGTHPSPAGQRKVAGQLLTFFKSDSTTKPWFVRPK